MLKKYEQKTGLSPVHIAPYGQLMTTLRYVSEGYGMLLCPSSAFYHLQESKQIHVLEVIEPAMRRDVVLMTNIQRPKTNLLLAVQKKIYQVIEAAHKKGDWQGDISFTE